MEGQGTCARWSQWLTLDSVCISFPLSLPKEPAYKYLFAGKNHIKKGTAMKLTRPVKYLFHKCIHRLGNVQGRRAVEKASIRSADSLQRNNYDVTPGPVQRRASGLSNIILLVEAGSLNILIDWRPGEKPAGAAAGGSTPGPFPHGSAVLQMFGGTRIHLGAIGNINGRNRLPAGSSDHCECAVKNKTIAISGHWITLRACKYVRTCSGLSSTFLSVRVFANWYLHLCI